MESVEPGTPLIWTIYGIVLLYFLMGGLGFYLINRKKPSDVARKSYLKYFTYFLIINILFVSIAFWPFSFKYLALAICLIGLYEIARLFIRSEYRHQSFFSGSVLVYILLSTGFFQFSMLDQYLVLYSFLIASIFDSFSQITGQLWGRHKILPGISPNKTTGGVLGGGIIAVLSGYLLGGLYHVSIWDRLILTMGIVLFAFVGDALASIYKRKYGVKDYSRMIPGHGGFLDRFDSLIACGAWVYLYFLFF